VRERLPRQCAGIKVTVRFWVPLSPTLQRRVVAYRHVTGYGMIERNRPAALEQAGIVADQLLDVHAECLP
jgi:hypothetical protein